MLFLAVSESPRWRILYSCRPHCGRGWQQFRLEKLFREGRFVARLYSNFDLLLHLDSAAGSSFSDIVAALLLHYVLLYSLSASQSLSIGCTNLFLFLRTCTDAVCTKQQVQESVLRIHAGVGSTSSVYTCSVYYILPKYILYIRELQHALDHFIHHCPPFA